jgi:hypothetical protein
MPQAHDPRAVTGSSSTTTSAARVRANRANARKSTGPRTAAGRRRSALNAITHGIFASETVLAGESHAQFVGFHNLLLDSAGLRPQSALEYSIAYQFVLAKWKLRRALGAEQVVHGEIAEEMADVMRRPAEDLAELLHKRERLIHLQAHERLPGDDLLDGGDDDDDDDDDDDAAGDAEGAARLARVNKMMVPILAMVDAAGLPPAATIAASFTHEDHDGAFERVAGYQHRLELSADRALRQLRQLRKDMGINPAELPRCPFLLEVPAEEDDATDTEDATDAKDAEERPAPGSVGDARVAHEREANAPVKNEPNGKNADTGDDAGAGCAQGSRAIEIVTPVKIPRRGGARPPRDETQGAD